MRTDYLLGGGGLLRTRQCREVEHQGSQDRDVSTKTRECRLPQLTVDTSCDCTRKYTVSISSTSLSSSMTSILDLASVMPDLVNYEIGSFCKINSQTSSPIAKHFDSFTRNSLPPETHFKLSCSKPVAIKQTGLSAAVRAQQHGHLWIDHIHSLSFSTTVVYWSLNWENIFANAGRPILSLV